MATKGWTLDVRILIGGMSLVLSAKVECWTTSERREMTSSLAVAIAILNAWFTCLDW